MNQESLKVYLLDAANHVQPHVAAAQTDDSPGIYAMFVREPGCLPSPYREELTNRGHRCLYVGKTSIRNPSLSRRLSKYDLNGEGDSTFFCSIGAVLGYRPQPGSLIGMKDQNNFRYSREDKQKIVTWIDQHLSVAWQVLSEAEANEFEAPVIRLVRLLLNITHNPSRLQSLRALRDQCRQIARSA